MKEVSSEEIILQGIISSCENLLDDLEQGANIEDKDKKDLVYADNVIMEIQQRVGSKLTPSNIESNNLDQQNSNDVFGHLKRK